MRYGTEIRHIKSVPIASKPVILEVKQQRLYCLRCHKVVREHLHFVTGKHGYTNKLANLVLELSRVGTIKDVASFLHLSWDTVKDIQKKYLKHKYKNPNLNGIRYIGIDEFAVAKGHKYKTIVVDLETGRVVYIGDGKDSASLDSFWNRVRKNNVRIEAVATDLSAAFTLAVMKNIPEATHVFDHFHVVKLMNDTLDKIRRDVYHLERDITKRKVIKGTRWLLLCNGKDLLDHKYKSRLDNALDMNKSLMIAYYLKEDLKEIWMQVDKEAAERTLDCWLEMAWNSKIPRIIKFANTLASRRTGILAWYDYYISTGKIEGINNKIKTMKRQAYGYRDQEFFELKILSMHDTINRFVG